MSAMLETPVKSLEELFDFLVDWHDITQVEPVEFPFALPKPLEQLYGRFGKAASDRCVTKDHHGLWWNEGIFAQQDFLVPASILHECVFVAENEPVKGSGC